MLQKIEHIGIAVKNIDNAITLYELLLQSPCHKKEIVKSQSVETAFLKADEIKIELLCSTAHDSAINKFITKRGEGLHHVAFQVDNIIDTMKALKEKNIRLLNEEPQEGADNKWICFLHPKDTHGVLIEICQEKT